MFDGVYGGRRVLVTGHTGFKGSWLCQWLLQLGAEVTGFSSYVPSQPSHFELLRLREHLKHRSGDVRSLEELSQVIGEARPEIVFHLAGQPIVRTSYQDPKLTFDTNLGGTVNVLEAMRGSDCVRAGLLITSDKCYENVEWEYGYRETDRLGGKDPYSASKACAELAFSAYARSFFAGPSGLRVAAARAGNVIGGGDWAASRIVPDCIRAWAKGAAPVIRSPGATRPWQHVLEPLSGYLWLAAELFEGDNHVSGESFNFGPGPEVNASVAKLVSEMEKYWEGVSWKLESDAPPGKPECGLLKLNCEKALQRLGWQATLSFETTVQMTAEWYRAYYSGRSPMTPCTCSQIRSYEQLALEREYKWAQS